MRNYDDKFATGQLATRYHANLMKSHSISNSNRDIVINIYFTFIM